MREIEMSDERWDLLLAQRTGGTAKSSPFDPEQALYGPIAAPDGAFVLAQVGQSLDGRVATLAGDARDISGPGGLAHLHRCRALVDAVIVGVGTVKADDPRLTVRLVKGRNPVRVVIDCRSELTGEERLFHDGGAPVVLIQGKEARHRAFPNAEIIRLADGPEGIEPQEILEVLRERSWARILVEGGARTISRFIEKGQIDRLHVTVSPLLIGSGPTGISLPPIDRLCDNRRPPTEIYALGSDVLFDCCLKSGTLSSGDGEKVRVSNLT